MTTDLRPMFGAHALQPDGLSAVYGGRWIVTQDGYTDLVPGRHGVHGDDTEALMAWLNDDRALHSARRTAEDLLKSYRMKTREAAPFILYEDRKGVIVANTNASAGYLYVTGWIFEDLPEGDPTKGLGKVLEASA